MEKRGLLEDIAGLTRFDTVSTSLQVHVLSSILHMIGPDYAIYLWTLQLTDENFLEIQAEIQVQVCWFSVFSVYRF